MSGSVTVAYLGFPAPGGKLSFDAPAQPVCGECMITLSLPRSGACNLATLIVPLCSPRGCCVVLVVS